MFWRANPPAQHWRLPVCVCFGVRLQKIAPVSGRDWVLSGLFKQLQESIDQAL